jgi:nucleoside-diphosphate-sugar epimerase
MSIQPKILLLGGGFTLSKLAARLAQSEFVITTTSKNKYDLFTQSAWNAELLDVSDYASFSKLLEKYPELEVVVDSVPPLKLDSGALAGVQNVAKASRNYNINRVLYLSSTGVFGGNDGEWVNEDTVPNPSSPSGRLRFEAENVYRQEITNFTALRISGIYGPGRGIGTALAQGRYQLVSGQNRWSNRIHVEDLISVIQNCIVTNNLPGLICVTDDEPALVRDVVDFYCREFKLTYPKEISVQDAENKGMFTLLSNQRISNRLLKEKILSKLKFPSYREGAFDEMITN